MATIASTAKPPSRRVSLRAAAPLATLARRRLALSVRTPRELIVPLVAPVLFAVVLAPALKEALGGFRGGGVDYAAFVAIATMGLLIPLNTMFAGIGVIVDRETGAQRELLAAPIRRPLLVLGNLAVALAITGLQLAALVVAAVLRGIDFDATARRHRLVHRGRGPAHDRHVRHRGNACQPHPEAGGIRRRHPLARDRALVLRRLAVPDRRPARGAHMDREDPPLDTRARPDALRAARRQGSRAPKTSGA